MHIKKLLSLLLFSAGALAQIPAPQINLTGNLGCQGFPCLNSGTLIMSADANRTMTAQETSAMFLKITSTVSLTATRNLLSPLGRFPYTIENATTGGQSIQIIGTTGTGVTIANGTTVAVWNDGTNFVQIGASGGGGGCAEGTCIQNNPAGATQTITNNASGLTGLGISNNNSAGVDGVLFTNDVGAALFGFGGSGVDTGSVLTFDNLTANSAISLQTQSGNIILKTGASTTALTANAAGGVVLNQVATSPNTAPICPNGTGGALTTSGCVAGSSLPTATAIGQGIYATGAGTTYQAANISKVPVEFEGATAYTSQAAAQAGADDTAKFQSAVTAAVNGIATCQAGMWYHVEGPVNFAANEGLVGTSKQTYGGQCLIVSNSASTHILSAVGSSSTYLTGITLANLNIRRSTAGTGTSAGIYSSFTGALIVDNVNSYDSIYDFYRHASPGDGVGYWSHLVAGWVLAESSGTYYGFYDDSADGNAENSIITSHVAVACQNFTGSAVSYGELLTGQAVNDNDTWDFNTAGCSYGQVINYTGSGNSFATNDIHWITSTHDGVGTSCYKVSNTSLATDGSLEINGGHCNSSTSGSALIDLETTYGVNIRGVDINQHNGFGASHAFYAASSSNFVFANNTVTNFGTASTSNTPIELTADTHSVVSGNTIVANSTNAGNIIWITGSSTFNSITGNNLSGYTTAGYGIGVDTGSNNNNCCGTNSIDTTHITSASPIGDGGTGNGASAPFNITNQIVATTNLIGNDFAPNQTAGASSVVYKEFGVNTSADNSLASVFGYVGAGSASNWYGWEFNLATYNARMYANISTEFGETTPAAGPANGIAVGTTGQFTVSGAGAVTAASLAVAAARKGTFVCTNAGTITITNANELVTSDVIISMNTAGGTITTPPAMKTVTSGTGFTVLCGATDTSTYNYTILN